MVAGDGEVLATFRTGDDLADAARQPLVEDVFFTEHWAGESSDGGDTVIMSSCDRSYREVTLGVRTAPDGLSWVHMWPNADDGSPNADRDLGAPWRSYRPDGDGWVNARFRVSISEDSSSECYWVVAEDAAGGRSEPVSACAEAAFTDDVFRCGTACSSVPLTQFAGMASFVVLLGLRRRRKA